MSSGLYGDVRVTRSAIDRRWLAWSAAVLLLFCCVLCVHIVGDYAVIRRIDGLGGKVLGTYNYLPKLLRDQLNGKYLLNSTVLAIQCNHPAVDDELARRLCRFDDLVALDLDNAQVTGSGLKHFVSLPRLRTLCLSNSRITSSDVQLLRKAPFIDTLGLNDVALDNDAVSIVAQISNLRRLHVENTKLTDDGLQNLSRSKTISDLWIGRNSITDAGLAQLSECESLRSLYVNDTHITDAGLRSLEPLAKLNELDVSGTHVTENGVSRLGHKLLNCEIKWTGGRYVPGVGMVGR